MHKVLYILMFVCFSLSLEAYSKKIILVSYTDEAKANAMLVKLQSRVPTLYKIAKKSNVEIKIKKLGKYYTIVAEVFTEKKVIKKALKDIQVYFKGAYIRSCELPKKKLVTTKVIEKIEITKNIEAPEVVEKSIVVETIKDIPKIEEVSLPKKKERPIEVKEILVEKKQSKIEVYIEQYFQWQYLIYLFIFSVLLYYYIKFKRVYDSY